MGIKLFFNRLRICVETTHNNQILLAVSNDNESILVKMADIAGQKISFTLDLSKHLLIGPGLVPVP